MAERDDEPSRPGVLEPGEPSPSGFALAGSGSGTVTTPAVYRPGVRYATSLGAVTADPGGRLTLTVPLGPPNPRQQDTLGARTLVYTTSVTIAPSRAAPVGGCGGPRTVTLQLRGLRHPVVLAGGRRVRVRNHEAIIPLSGRRGGAVLVRVSGIDHRGRRVHRAMVLHPCR